MNALKAFIKPFEAPQRSIKIKIYLDFLSLSGIGTGRGNGSFMIYQFEKLHNGKEVISSK